MADEPNVLIRFILNLPTEDLSYIDVMFDDDRQARRALRDIISANGTLVSIKGSAETPILIRSEDVAAAYPLTEGNGDEDAEDDEDEEDGDGDAEDDEDEGNGDEDAEE